MTKKLHMGRRSSLELLTTGLVAATTGCLVGSDNTPSDGSEATLDKTDGEGRTASPNIENTGRPSTSAQPTTPEYLEWVFATNLMESSSILRPYRLERSEFLKYDDRLNPTTHKTVNTLSEYPMVELPIALGDAHEIIGTRRTYIVRGDFTQRKIDRGRDTRFERVPPEYQGFLIYVDSDENQAIAGRDNLAIAIEDIPDNIDPRNVAKSVIDTGRGEHPRLLNEMPHIGPMASWLGVHHLTQIEPHEPYLGDGPLAGKTGKGIGWSLSEDGVTCRAVIQFKEPGQATEEAISTALEEELPVTNTWTELSRTRQGGVVIVDGEVSYDTLLKTSK